LAQAGVDKIGLGALIGLEDWRTDSFFYRPASRLSGKAILAKPLFAIFSALTPLRGGVTAEIGDDG
jgi:tyrosine lyase ThiH